MTDSRTIVGRLLPVHLTFAAVFHGVKDHTAPVHAKVLGLLDRAVAEEVEGLPAHQVESVKRHAKRAAETLLAPFVKAQMPCAKFGLIVFYAINELIEAGAYQRFEGAFEEALAELLDDDSTLAEFANVDGIDASAQKQARKLIRAMQGLGYFTGVGSSLLTAFDE